MAPFGFLALRGWCHGVREVGSRSLNPHLGAPIFRRSCVTPRVTQRAPPRAVGAKHAPVECD
jgi:hypothetical protein